MYEVEDLATMLSVALALVEVLLDNKQEATIFNNRVVWAASMASPSKLGPAHLAEHRRMATGRSDTKQ